MLGDAATWTVAAATIGLALFTGALFFATYQMVKKAGSQVDLEQRRLAAQQRPHVYPVTVRKWVFGQDEYQGPVRWSVIPLGNAGPGVAHNVTGFLRFADGIVVPIVPLTIQPGERYDAALDWGGQIPRDDRWANSRCCVLYDDVVGEAWVTDFTIREVNNRRYFDFERAGPLSEFGDLYQWFQIPQGAMMYADPDSPLQRALATSLLMTPHD